MPVGKHLKYCSGPVRNKQKENTENRQKDLTKQESSHDPAFYPSITKGNTEFRDEIK